MPYNPMTSYMSSCFHMDFPNTWDGWSGTHTPKISHIPNKDSGKRSANSTQQNPGLSNFPVKSSNLSGFSCMFTWLWHVFLYFQVFMIFPRFSHDFPLIFPWFSHDFPMIPNSIDPKSSKPPHPPGPCFFSWGSSRRSPTGQQHLCFGWSLALKQSSKTF